MRRYRIILGLTILMTVTILVGCSDGSKPADTPAPAEKPAEQSTEQSTEQEGPSVKEAINDTENNTAGTTEEEETTDSGKDNMAGDEHILKATYSGNGYQFLVEEDKSKEVTKGIPINYLYIQYNGGNKMLLAQSVDQGNDWTNSVAGILNPTISNDGRKVYYETDDTFTRTNGYGAQNHRTRVVDIETLEDSYFQEGAIMTLLNRKHGSYADHLILQLNSINDAGEPTFIYQVVTPECEQLVILDTYIPDDLTNLIDSKLQEQNSPNESSQAESEYLTIVELPANGVEKSSLEETYHGELIEHNRYAAVVVEDYPYEGEYPFRYGMQYTNPAYPEASYSYSIAVMGEVYNVRIKSKEGFRL